MNEIIDLHISDEMTEYILWCWDTYKKNKDNLRSTQYVATAEGIQTKNIKTLKDFMEDKTFQDCLEFIWNTLKAVSGEDLYYHWMHFVEYERGGYQTMHSHAHEEDYSAILYLNNCRGGETFFMNPPKSFSPKKGNIVLFPSNFTHGAKKTTSWFVKKKVLVLGLRKY